MSVLEINTSIVQNQQLSLRVQREQEAYNEGLQRDGYMRVFEHTSYLFLQRRDQIVRNELEYAQGKNVLELGSISWESWIEGNDIKPSNLHCINISQEEIKQGEKFGIIRFGSRVDLYFDNYEIMVQKNQKTVSGETLIAKKK